MARPLAVLSALVGVSILVGQAAAIGSLDDPALTTIRGWMWLGTVAFAAPWLVGAVLLLVRTQVGATVVATAAMLTVPGLLLGWVFALGAQLVGTGTLGWGAGTWVAVLRNLILVAGMATVGAVAWRQHAPTPAGRPASIPPLHVVASLAAVSGLVLSTTRHRTPWGSLHSYVPTVFSWGPDLGVLLLTMVELGVSVLVLGLALWLPRPAAGAAVLTFAVPSLLAEVADLGRAVAGPDSAVVPWAAVVVAGLVTLVAVGAAWALDRDVPAAELSRV